ncbi:MAG: indolepyruvate ferredoxin oxidoreductase family protein, partial [Bradyrhizobiaceae bacterium]|nr:indolepyruvate ferredoxin oxidoreductase family protein [Bradyrhizobiaceae bacterium]
LSAEAIEQAIALNGEAVEMNRAAFRWGRRAAVDLASVEALAKPAAPDPARAMSTSIDDVIARRVEFLTAYQDAAYAARYRRRVDAARAAETSRTADRSGFAEAVARYLFKLMAYKDEYEVARLHADQAFLKQVRNEVDGDNLRLTFHLSPPLLAKRNSTTGEPLKMSFGPWILPVFGALSRLKFLRGTPFDPFGYTDERKTERQLLRDYETLVDELVAKLTPENHDLAVGLAAIPEKIRGFGHVKRRHIAAAKAEEATLMEQFRAGSGTPMLKAAE